MFRLGTNLLLKTAPLRPIICSLVSRPEHDALCFTRLPLASGVPDVGKTFSAMRSQHGYGCRYLTSNLYRKKGSLMTKHVSSISAPAVARGLVQASVVPRGIMAGAEALRAIQASQGAGGGDRRGASVVLAELQEGFEDFKSTHAGRLGKVEATVENLGKGVQAAIDDISARIAAGTLGSSVLSDGIAPPDPEYSTTYASWFRSGQREDELRAQNSTGHRAAVQAAMSVGSDSNGGYLAPVEWDRRVTKALSAVSPLRRIANVIPTTVRAYSTLWNDGAWGSGWVGETASRPNTGNAELKSLTFASGEIYANPAVTQQLLDDADFAIERWLADEVADTFNAQESIAFLSGNGINKPNGLLTYVTGGANAATHPGGTLTVVPSGAASALGNSDSLVDFVYGLAAPYRQNARWLMNSMTAAAIAKIKDGQGNYLWRETYVAGQPATLLGYPVEIDENMPNIAAGALPIAFGDFKRGYVINDRVGTRLLRDPYTNKPFVNFYVTKRVGGGVFDINAVRLMKIAAS
jgi:HK97 family phage major capsid protein